MKRYRVGDSWRVTVVEFDPAEVPDRNGRRPSDRLMGTGQTPEYAQRIAVALNAQADRDCRD